MSRQEPTDLEQARWRQFGAWLRDLRQGRTQTDVGAEAKLGIQALASLERGGFRRYDDGPWLVPNPKDETLIRLARALGVDPEEMFKRVGRYDERPQTTGSRRRQDRRAARIDELEGRNAELEERIKALEEQGERWRRANAELEERQRRTEALLREHGIDAEPPQTKPRRRRAPG
jgi:transcriptional regulator with XRE-family HTH domain